MKKSTQKTQKNKSARRTTKAAAKVSKQKPGRRQRPAKYEGEKLPAIKRKVLVALERKITKGLAEFVKIGDALNGINDERLYRSTHKTFDEYCRERWKFSPKHAYRLMAAAEIVEQMKAGKGQVPSKYLPKRESQVRPLARLCESRLNPLIIWKRAIKEAEGKAPSAALVSKLVNERLGKSGSRASKKRGGRGVLTPNDKIAKIQKLLEKAASAAESKKFYQQTLVKIRKLVGQPKV